MTGKEIVTRGDREVERQAVQEALRCRLSVLRNLDKPDRGTRIALELMGLAPWEAEPVHRANAELIRMQMIDTLVETEMFIAPPEMCALLNARPEVPGDGGTQGPSVGMSYPGETLRVRDVITPVGMVYFADPIDDPAELHPGLIPIRAISWSVARGDDPAIRFLDAPPDAMMITVIGYSDTRDLPSQAPSALLLPPHRRPKMTVQELQVNPRIYPVVPVVWQLDVRGGGLFWDDEDSLQEAQTLRLPYIKTLMAWWTVMRQRLTEQEDVVLPHPKELTRVQRRHARLNTDAHVIRLRPRKRYRYTEYSGGGRPDWRFSWMVRSHWREDWRARRRGEEDCYRLISSYEKGPMDKPLKGAEKVFLPPLPHRSQR